MLAVGTSSGIYRFEAHDGAWELHDRSLEDEAISGIAAEVGPGGRVVASARHTGLYQSDDRGATWSHVLADVDPWTVALAPDGTVYAGVEPAGVYRSRPAGEGFEECAAVRTLPSYRTWTFPQAPFMGNIRSFAFSRRDPRTVYAAVEVGGVLCSTDGGETWTESHEGLHIDVHTVGSAPGDGDILYAATGRGFYRSPDGGVSWESACEGFRGLYAVPLAVHPKMPEVVFTAVAQGRPRYSRGPAGASVTLYRSIDGAATWEPIMSGLPETLAGAVAALAVDAEEGTLYAGTTDGSVLAGRSLGDSWDVIAEGLPSVRALAVV